MRPAGQGLISCYRQASQPSAAWSLGVRVGWRPQGARTVGWATPLRRP